MTTKLLCFITSAMVTLSPDMTAATNRLQFPVAGFSIAPLDSPPGESPQQVLMMWLPQSEGFAPNVNVQIQPYTGSMEDYVALTLEQIKAVGAKVLQQKTQSKSVAVIEYTLDLQGRQLHCYARAEKTGDKVYLTTATTTPQRWGKEATRLKTCVDSFRCESGGVGSPPAATPPPR